MINFTYFLSFFLLFQFITGAPVAKLITRVHTAAPVTKTNTYTTGTTTISLPPVEIFISNGVTYTFTMTDQPAGTPTTTTSVLNDNNNNDGNNGNGNNQNGPQTTDPATNNGGDASPTAANTPQDTTPSSPQETNAGSPPATSSATSPATTNGPESTSEQTTSAGTTEAPETSTLTSTSQEATTSSETSSSSVASSIGSGSISAPTAIAYSPYEKSGCKDASTIESDLKSISDKGIKKIRVYGTDCGLYDTTLPKANKFGIKVNQGLWITAEGVDSVDDPLSGLIEYGQKNGYDVFDFITVGNEAVNTGYCSASDLADKIKSVKSKLRDSGYQGKVTTSEPPNTFIDNPTLCTDSGIDFVGINPHSYFDTEIGAALAGWYVTSQQSSTAKACNNMDVVITETGYPSKGDSNGDNTPSVSNQEIALKSIMEKTGGKVTILSAFDDFWKEPGPHGIEQYFGCLSVFS